MDPRAPNPRGFPTMRRVTLPDGTTRVRLETWGEIASHLGVEVRTAQRWERRMGIPIRRLDGGQAVFAYADELDQWLDKKQLPPVIAPDPPAGCRARISRTDTCQADTRRTDTGLTTKCSASR